MIALIFLPIYILLNLYIYKRLIKWLQITSKYFNSKVFRFTLIFIFIFLANSLLIGLILPVGIYKTFFNFIGNYYLGISIYILLVLGLFELLRIILKHFKVVKDNNVINILVGLFCILVITMVSFYGVINARIINVKHYNVNINKSGGNINGLKIVMISDLHLGYNIGVNHMKNMVKKINKENPDLVLIAGDIFDNDYDSIGRPNEIIRIFKKIKTKYGIYAVYGNHDISEKILAGFTFDFNERSKHSDKRMDKLLEDANIKLLRDEYVLIKDSFYLVGRLDYSKLGIDVGKRKEPKELLEKIDKNKPVFVIDHEPVELDKLSKNGVDLDLSGHTHDGQIFPLNILIKLKYKHSYGIKKYGNMISIVTSGVGLYGPNMRVGTKAEIISINVKFSK